MTDYEGRRRWFREHPSAHYLLNVVLGIVGFVVLGGLLGRLLAPNDPTYGFSLSGVITRAITGSVVMLFVTWYIRRLFDMEPQRQPLRQPWLWLLLAPSCSSLSSAGRSPVTGMPRGKPPSPRPTGWSCSWAGWPSPLIGAVLPALTARMC